ncbi:metal-dependent hydrolase [Herbiconiux sp. CPCC 205763]|uniref:Metal-dependent hydrolase n=1 Tax=Herbiconiux aconitum TaxID=2970913 RepID=A0ABT2GLT0_9MICO|nr:metal-dependent hydrolase [Herbiconiux aconitum]MCS5717081.1 metal-dependent hydrolase [Herbiconiux aconitum]
MTDMALPRVDTVVTYPSGSLVSSGTVVHVEPLGDGRVVVLLDETACHPVDAAWPDQGADRATLTVGGHDHPVVDCVVGATDGAQLFLGSAVPVRPGADGWAFVVAHVLAPVSATESPHSDGMAAAIATDSGDSMATSIAATGGGLVEGAAARVEVDAAHRRALSAGHTACHLASLALNEALAGAWTKDVARDGRGNPDFDQLSIETSTIEPNGSLDVYRIGKSLRKKGFAPAVLTEGSGGGDAPLEALAAAVDARLAEWSASGARVEVQRDGDDRGLSARRTWTCHLPEGAVSIPCGGTHVASLAEFASIRVAFDLVEQPGALELRMRTTATLAVED